MPSSIDIWPSPLRREAEGRLHSLSKEIANWSELRLIVVNYPINDTKIIWYQHFCCSACKHSLFQLRKSAFVSQTQAWSKSTMKYITIKKGRGGASRDITKKEHPSFIASHEVFSNFRLSYSAKILTQDSRIGRRPIHDSGVRFFALYLGGIVTGGSKNRSKSHVLLYFIGRLTSFSCCSWSTFFKQANLLFLRW